MRSSALAILTSIFAVLTVGRIAMAATEPQEVKDIPAAPVEVAAVSTEKTCLSPATAEILMKDQDRIEAENIKLLERQAAVKAMEDKLSEKLALVEKTNAELQGKIDYLKGAANEDVIHLVTMYQTMKPSQAAEIFNSMDPAFAAGFLRQMDGQNAGMILANMDAKKSYAISVIIAGQNAKYRKS